MKKTYMALALSLMFGLAHAGEIVVIGHSNVPQMDTATIQKVYTGKVISVSGVSVVPVGVKPGSSVRNSFLHEFLNEDEEKYTAYWTVRRYIGKGAPPTEFDNAAEVIRYVQANSGAVGYIDESDLKPGMNVIVHRRTVGRLELMSEDTYAQFGSVVSVGGWGFDAGLDRFAYR